MLVVSSMHTISRLLESKIRNILTLPSFTGYNQVLRNRAGSANSNVPFYNQAQLSFSSLSKEEEGAEKERVASLTEFDREIELREFDKELSRLNTLRGINTGGEWYSDMHRC